MEQYHKFHSRETLERCWDVKTAVAKRILDANETNDCKLPHGIKHEERVSVNLSLDSDDTDDPVARTLDYEGLHASLPSPNLIYLCCTSCDLDSPRVVTQEKQREKKTPSEFTNHESSQHFRNGGIIARYPGDVERFIVHPGSAPWFF